jgi:hypothetical protein
MLMTDSDLRALGWVVTRDTFWEVVRSLAGRTPRLPLAAMQGLGARWQALQTTAANSSDSLLARITSSPLSRRTSADICAAAANFLTFMSTSCPELYSLHAMGERCRRGSAKAIAGIGGSIGLGLLASSGYSLIEDAAVVLFAMGTWHLWTSIQLRCVRRLMLQLTDPHVSSREPDAESLSVRDGRPHRERR